jgi:hypothetical protein
MTLMPNCCGLSDDNRDRRELDITRGTSIFRLVIIASMLAIAACGVFSGCQKASKSSDGSYALLEKYGYVQSVVARPLVESVIENCNQLISPDLAIRLDAEWKNQEVRPSPTVLADSTPHPLQPSPTASEGATRANETHWARTFDPSVTSFLNPTPLPTKLRISVYLIRGIQLSDKEVSFVPNQDRCVFINAPGVKYLSELFHSANSSPPTGADDETELALTLIVLHEVGHIVNGDAGSFVESEFPPWDEITGSLGDAKNRELKADFFAVEQINKARQRSFPVTILPLGARIAAFVGSSSFRTGMSQASTDISIYRDKGSTHPNFYLRLLIMSNKLYPNPFSADLLRSFVEKRKMKKEKGQS